MQRLERPTAYDDALASVGYDYDTNSWRGIEPQSSFSLGQGLGFANNAAGAIQGISNILSGRATGVGSYVNTLGSAIGAAQDIAKFADLGRTPVLDQIGVGVNGVGGAIGLYNTFSNLSEGNVDVRSLLAAPGQIASVANMAGVGGLDALSQFSGGATAVVGLVDTISAISEGNFDAYN